MSTPAVFLPFESWGAVIDAVRAGEAVYYQAPLSYRPVLLRTTGPADARGRAIVRGYLNRTIRIRPYDCPEEADRFIADRGHFERFLRRENAQ